MKSALTTSSNPMPAFRPSFSAAMRMVLFATLAWTIAACGEKTESDDHMNDNDSAHDNGHAHDDGGHSDHGTTQTTRIEFAAEPAAIPVGKPATWTITVVDAKTGEPVTDFDIAHEKLMHLIVVSADLSWFNHIHPRHEGNGVFTVETTLPASGTYRLYADYLPKGKSQEVLRHELATEGGQPSPTMILPVPDTLNSDGLFAKTVGSNPEGSPDQIEGSYHVTLQPMPTELTAGTDVMLHFRVNDAAGKPVALEPYLGAMGHVVIISSDGKEFLHAHPTESGAEGGEHEGHGEPSTGGAGTEVVFHTNFPAPGFYKVWGQFQKGGRIITAPFVLKIGS